MYSNTFGRVPVSATVNAGFWRRCAAYLIDGLLLSAISWIVAVILAGGFLFIGYRNGTVGAAVGYVVILTIDWLYFALQECSGAQATLGKRALDLKVVDERGERIAFGRATFRFVGKTISALILGIGFLPAGVTARKQALHDLLAGTFVIFREVNPGQPIPVERPPMPWYGWLLNGALLAYPVVVAAFTFPAYNDYMLRSQVIEAVIAGDAAKTAVAEFYIDKNRCPDSAAEAGLGDSGAASFRYVQNVTIAPDCVVVVTLADSNRVGASLRGQRIEMSGRPDAQGILVWNCAGTFGPQLLPPDCRK